MIRNCIHLCALDQPCIERCVERGSDAGRALYEEIVICSTQYCPGGDIDCRCIEECFVGGACLSTVDECTQALQEGFCNSCH